MSNSNFKIMDMQNIFVKTADMCTVNHIAVKCLSYFVPKQRRPVPSVPTYT